MDRKVLIIAGMHRSATSVITQWLYRCGLNVGDELMGPHIGNPDGHFEDIDFFHLHETILQFHSLPGSGLTHQLLPPLLPDERRALANLIAEKNKCNAQWGWKDPRTCLFLAEYRQIIPAARYLIVIRDYTSSVSSLINRDFQNAIKIMRRKNYFIRLQVYFKKKQIKKDFYKKLSEVYLKVWISYNTQIAGHLALVPQSSYIVVDSNWLLEHDRQVIAHLNKNWGFSLKKINFKEVYKNRLINEHILIASFIKDQSLVEKAGQIYKQLSGLFYKSEF